MDHFSGLQFDDEKGEERAEEEVSNLQEIAGPNLSSMIVQECGPILSSRSRDARLPHIFLDRSLTYANIQLEQLTTNALGSEDAGCSWPLP